MRKSILAFLTLSFFIFKATGQRLTHNEYINLYKEIAVKEMLRTGVPASITLAQGILESEYGNSPLVKSSNNHFGIKCKSNWLGPSVSHDDDEVGECFRKYSNAEESYRDHSDFLRNSPRYAGLFNLNPQDYKSWAFGLKSAGYATNPKYADLLIKYVEMFDLQQFDVLALSGSNTLFAKVDNHQHKNIKPPVEQVVISSPVIMEAPTVQPAPFSKLKINRANAVFVPKGTSLLAVAMKYKVRLPKLLEYNDLTRDGLLEKDQYVFLEKKQPFGDVDYCYSQQGENLYDISQRYGVSFKHVTEFNNVHQQSALSAGTKIFLKPKTAIAARGNASADDQKAGVL